MSGGWRRARPSRAGTVSGSGAGSRARWRDPRRHATRGSRKTVSSCPNKGRPGARRSEAKGDTHVPGLFQSPRGATHPRHDAKIAVSEIPAFLGKAYSSVAELIGRSELNFAGPPFARHRPLDSELAEFEVEAGFPVDRPAEAAGDVIASSLPEGEVAVVTSLGTYDGMRPAYDAIEA